jgi:hypothetical protein
VYTLTRDILISNAKSSAILCDCDVGEDLEDGDADKVIVKPFVVEGHEPDEPLRMSKLFANDLYEDGVEFRDFHSTMAQNEAYGIFRKFAGVYQVGCPCGGYLDLLARRQLPREAAILYGCFGFLSIANSHSGWMGLWRRLKL